MFLQEQHNPQGEWAFWCEEKFEEVESACCDVGLLVESAAPVAVATGAAAVPISILKMVCMQGLRGALGQEAMALAFHFECQAGGAALRQRLLAD
eukprot:12791609-Alexandrium_andersonii.AAC.1